MVGREHHPRYLRVYIFQSTLVHSVVQPWNIRDDRAQPPVCELYGYSIRCRRPDRVVMRLCVIRGSQLRPVVFLPFHQPPRQIYCPTMNRNRVYAPKRFAFIVSYGDRFMTRRFPTFPRRGFEFAFDKLVQIFRDIDKNIRWRNFDSKLISAKIKAASYEARRRDASRSRYRDTSSRKIRAAN